MVWTEAVVALGASGVLSLGAWLRRSLTTSGAIAATVVGFSVWLGTGRVGFVALCAFFLTSTLLARVGRTRKRPLQLDYEKGDRRDAWQVFANGGVAAVLALGACMSGAGPFPQAFAADTSATLALAAVASLASANADTWATELGVLWRQPPRSLWTWQTVPPGTSGAVSLGGLLAAMAGALVVALVAAQLPLRISAARVVFELTAAGFLGALVDSALGNFQQQYKCGVCGKTVEAKNHCTTTTHRIAARRAVLNNDGVNALANASASVIVLLAG